MRPSNQAMASRLDRLEAWTAPAPVDRRETAAVLAPLIERQGRMNVILTLRPKALRRHAGQIAFPGGRSDPGELPWETALREACEEIGLRADQVEILGLLEQQRAGLDFMVTPVVGVVAPDFVPVPSPAEVEEVFEVPLAFLMDPANHKEHVVRLPDGQHVTTTAMPYEDRFIWGATAGMLRQLYERLRDLCT